MQNNQINSYNCTEMQVEESSLLNDNAKYKVVFLGQSAVGKTSIVQHIANGSFSPVQQPTVYLDSVRKNVIHNGRLFRLVLWDTAGQEKFNSLVPSSIRGSHCAIIVFSLDDRNSFLRCDHWIKLLRSSSAHNCPAILIANKTDLARNVTKHEAFDFATQHGMAYMQVSAKSGAGMENLIAQVIQSVEGKLQTSTKSSEDSKKSLKTLKSTAIKDSKLELKKPVKCCCAI